MLSTQEMKERSDKDEEQKILENQSYFLVLHKKSDNWSENNKIRPLLYTSLNAIPNGTKYVVLSQNATIADRMLVEKTIKSIKEFG